jgi:hypothetical protein
MQAHVCRTVAVPGSVRAAAAAYDELLYGQLGLGDAQEMRTDDDFASLLMTIEDAEVS